MARDPLRSWSRSLRPHPGAPNRRGGLGAVVAHLGGPGPALPLASRG